MIYLLTWEVLINGGQLRWTTLFQVLSVYVHSASVSSPCQPWTKNLSPLLWNIWVRNVDFIRNFTKEADEGSILDSIQQTMWRPTIDNTGFQSLFGPTIPGGVGVGVLSPIDPSPKPGWLKSRCSVMLMEIIIFYCGKLMGKLLFSIVVDTHNI